MVEERDKTEMQPRFYVELNEPFVVFGLNLMGFAPALMVAAVFAGLTLWTMVPLCIPPFYFLAKRMAKEPDFLRELGLKVRESNRFLIPLGVKQSRFVIVSKDGYALSASEWGQYSAFRKSNPGKADLSRIYESQDQEKED